MAQEALALSVVSRIFDSLVSDVVAIYNSDYQQLFRNARPLKAEISEDSKLMDHPLEDGTTIIDHRILLPVEIEFDLLLSSIDFQDVYQEIKQAFINADLLIISTRSGTFENQLIQSMPHVETSEIYNGFILTLSTKEANFVTPASVSSSSTGSSSSNALDPQSPADKSNINKGTVQSEEIPEQKATESSVLYDKFFGG